MFDPEKHHRRSVRLPDHSYAEGAYFVTICTHNRVAAFGEMADDQVHLTRVGEIAYEQWLQTAVIRPYVKLDAFVIMPNHIHAILFLDRTWQRHAPTPLREFSQPLPASLGTIIGAYKSVVTRQVNVLHSQTGGLLWQRGYHEHVIRDEKRLNALREYIEFNPARWAEDKENPGKR